MRLLLLALMLGSLLLSASIPEAFGHRGWMFGCAFAAMQIGRSLFVVAALRGHRPANHRNFVRITTWLAVSGIFWVLGAFADGSGQGRQALRRGRVHGFRRFGFHEHPTPGASGHDKVDLEPAQVAEEIELTPPTGIDLLLNDLGSDEPLEDRAQER